MLTLLHVHIRLNLVELDPVCVIAAAQRDPRLQIRAGVVVRFFRHEVIIGVSVPVSGHDSASVAAHVGVPTIRLTGIPKLVLSFYDISFLT